MANNKAEVECEKIYYAKSKNDYHYEVLNKDHLINVSQLAGIFGEEIGKREEAELAGKLHDFGKYSEAFQRVLKGEEKGIDHAFPGAVFIYNAKNLNKKFNTPIWKTYEPIIESVQGHHDGLTSLNDLSRGLNTVADTVHSYCPSGKIPSIRGEEAYGKAIMAFKKDFPDFKLPKLCEREADNKIEDMLDTRMLFSCLVDADYSTSAADNERDYLAKSSGKPLNVEEALNRLIEYRQMLSQTSTAAKTVVDLRNYVFESCGNSGDKPMGLFTLTAPTGLGKTMAMLYFALRHCKKHNLRRIIVVLPFLSLAEQTEREYKKIFTEMLVDHSQRELPENMREMAARWDSPVIITTSVRFFESVFASKPTDCRKLHNIAGSVILFDEAQSLPAELAESTVKAVSALCKKYKCSMLFSTATQPDFNAVPNVKWQPVELLDNPKALFQKMQRVTVDWRLYKNEELKNNPSLADIAAEISQKSNVCCLVNLRRHAKILVKELINILQSDKNVFLLSTDLCPAHRLKVIEEIKKRQKNKEPCFVIATQCIEAGVDLDFEVMYRALAPLEAIVQAAGRCNRNGSLQNGGSVVVFEPNESGRLYPANGYERGAGIVKNILHDKKEFNLTDPESIKAYYERFFAGNPKNKELEDAIEIKDYKNVAEKYRLINNAGIRLVVPWVDRAELFEEISEANDSQKITLALLRKAAPITITCFENDSLRDYISEIYIYKYGKRLRTGYYLINTGFEKYYDSNFGLFFESTTSEDYII